MVLRTNDKALGRLSQGRRAMPPTAVARILPGVGKPLLVALRQLLQRSVVGILAIPLSREQRVQGMAEIVRPDGVHPVPAAASLSNQARVVVRALSDQVDVPPGFHRQGGNPVSEFLNERVRGVVQYSVYRVESQGVNMALAQPPKRILDKVVPNAVASRAVEVYGGAPGSVVAIGKIRSKTAGEAALRPKVVVDDVQDNCDSAPMASVDQTPQPVDSPVRVLRGVGIDPRRNPSSAHQGIGPPASTPEP